MSGVNIVLVEEKPRWNKTQSEILGCLVTGTGSLQVVGTCEASMTKVLIKGNSE